MAVGQLKFALDMYDTKPAQDDPDIQKCMRGNVIQTFEYTYELSFKMVRRHLSMASGSPDTINAMTFSDVIREAYGKDIVRSDVVAWRKYRDRRGITSHAYNEDKAQEVFVGAPDFLDEARYLLDRLRERNKSLG